MVYLAHEALIDAPACAKNWLAQESGASGANAMKLTREAAVWVRHGQRAAWLGAEADKDQTGFARWRTRASSPQEASEDYARLSKQRAVRNSVIKRGAVAAILALGVLAGFKWWQEARQRQLAQSAPGGASAYAQGVLVSLRSTPRIRIRTAGRRRRPKSCWSRRIAKIDAETGPDSLARASVLTAMGQASASASATIRPPTVFWKKAVAAQD